MKLAVQGSRSLSDERVKVLLLEEIERWGVDEIVTSGEPTGVCQVARELCKERAIPLELEFLNFRYLRGAFEHRSQKILARSDRAIFIHDGKSRGTMNELRLAQKMGLPHRYVRLDPQGSGGPESGDWVMEDLPGMSELDGQEEELIRTMEEV